MSAATTATETYGERMYAWITARLAEGWTIYVSTIYKHIVVRSTRADALRLHKGRCQIRRGKHWDIIEGCRITATKDKQS